MDRLILRMQSCTVYLSLLLSTLLATAQEPPHDFSFESIEGSTTDAEYWAGWVEFQVKDLSQNYAKFSQGPAEAKQKAPEYFRAVIEMLATHRHEMDLSAKAWEELLAQGEQQAKLDPQDPLILYCQGTALFHAKNIREARPKLEAAVKSMESSEYPRWLMFPLLYERHRLMLRMGSTTVEAPSQQKLVEYVPLWLARAIDLPDARRYLWDYYENAFDNYAYNPQGKQHALLQAFAKQDKKDPWLWEMAQGLANNEAAWRFRGGGYAPTVTPEGWQKFGEQMRLADEHYRAAHKIAPQYPEAATKLISVAMAGHDEETIFDWFGRAFAAQCDYLPAYDAFMWSLRPRWGGSHELMLEFARQCARSNRFDTRIPYLYYTTSNDVRMERDDSWQTYVKDPLTYRRLKFVLEKMADHPSRAGKDGKLSTQQAYYLTKALVLALHAEQHEDAVILIERLGDEVQQDTFERMKMGYPFGIARMYAHREFKDEIEELRELSKSTHESLEAAQRFLSFVETLEGKNKEPGAAPYFEDVTRRAQMEVDFHEGEWVELTFDPYMRDWLHTENQWTYESEKSVIASSVGSEFGFNCFHRCQFPGPREVMCNIEVLETFVPYTYVGIYHGSFRKAGAMFWMEPLKKQLGATVWDATKLPYLNIQVPKLDHMHVRVWGPERVELYGNGRWQHFINKGEQYAIDPSQTVLNRVGFGSMWNRTSTSTVRFSNVRVRKLGDMPPPWSGENGEDTSPAIIKYYDEELKNNPDFTYGYLFRGLAHCNAQNYEQAIADLERGLKEIPEEMGYRGLLGLALCQTGKYQEGIEALERSLREANPKRLLSGSEIYKTAFFLATAPDDKLRNGPRALELANKKIAATGKDEFYPLLALSVAQAENGQFDEAIATVDKLTTMAKSDESRQALARYRESFLVKKPWRHNAEKAEEDAYWIGDGEDD